jgi:type I restriction enzyme S subunit
MSRQAYPKYKPSGIEWLGEIPSHWDIAPIRGFAESGYKTFTDGDWIESPFIQEEGIRLIQTGNIGIGEYREQGFRYIDEETFRQFHCTEISPDDVLICRLADPVGRACLAPDLGVRMITSVDVCILKPRDDVHAGFVVYALSSQYYLSWLSAICRGGTRDRISRSMLGAIRIQKPPLVEQRAIAAFLARETARIDGLIEKKERQVELLQEKRAALVHKATKEIGTLNLRLGVVADQVCRAIVRDDEKIYVPIGLYNRGRGVFHKEPTLGAELGDSDFSWIKSGDLVLSGQFAWEGAVALAGEEEAGCVATHRYPVLRGKPEFLDTAYLFAFFTTRMGDFLLNEHSRGAAGRNRPLNVDTLMKEAIPVPPMAAQLRVSKHVYFERRFREVVADSLRFLGEYRTALISAAVTGEIDVREEVS